MATPADQRLLELLDKWLNSVELHLKYSTLAREPMIPAMPHILGSLARRGRDVLPAVVPPAACLIIPREPRGIFRQAPSHRAAVRLG